MQGNHQVVGSYLAPVNPADGYFAFVRIIIQVGYQYLKGAGFYRRGRHSIQNSLEERADVLALHTRFGGGNAFLGTGIEHAEIKLVIPCNKLKEEVLGGAQHLGYARILPVYLVDDHYGLETLLQCVAQHELGVRHGAVD